MPFVDDLIDAGIDILSPVQPNTRNMDHEYLKTKYGKKLSFHGGVDTQNILSQGDPSAIEKEVMRRIRILAKGGGFILSPSHHVQADVPVENIIALRDAVQKHGVYPIYT